jgi:hypothetical protein
VTAGHPNLYSLLFNAVGALFVAVILKIKKKKIKKSA